MRNMSARFSGRQGSFDLDVSFTLPGDGCTGIFGPSGCGKTTILRCIAGLQRFNGSVFRFGDDVWQDETRFLPPHKRPLGYVFQEPRLFPHLSVAGNLHYGMRRAKDGAEDPSLSFERVTDLMGITGFLNRRPDGLSGGEQQRVAIARALLTRPRLLLMDEPLSALDRDSRLEILPYLESLHRQLHLPILYVTHDFSEIERLADYLLLIEPGGKIRASGRLSDLLTDLTLPIARQPDAASILPVTVRGYDAAYDLSTCAIDGLSLLVPGRCGAPGEKRRLSVRASDVSLVRGTRPEGSTLLNILPAHIVRATPVGKAKMLILLNIDCQPEGVPLIASITRKSWDTLKFTADMPVFAQVKSMALADPDTAE